MLRHGWNVLLFGACLLCEQALAAGPAPPALRQSGSLSDLELSEVSGLAASRLQPGIWWLHNDSGHGALLYAVDDGGRLQRRVAVTGAASVDWEDLASYRQDGRAYLAVADTGDNFGLRSWASVYVVPEPAQGLATEPAREIRFTWEDGPRDCESLAADPAQQRFLLIDKGRHPAGLYTLPMHPPAGPVVARRLADLPPLWAGPVAPVETVGAERWRGAATAADLSADGRRLLVLTYRHLLQFERRDGEDWPQALARPPQTLALPKKQRLFEAAGYAADGHGALLTREGPGTVPLFRWDGWP